MFEKIEYKRATKEDIDELEKTICSSVCREQFERLRKKLGYNG